MNSAVNTGVWFVSQLIGGIKNDRSSFRTPEQMSKNVNETDLVPFLWIGGLVAGFCLLMVLKLSFKKNESI